MTKKKEKKLNHEDTLPRPMVFYQNYDYVDNDPNGPGEGPYKNMDKYKSIDDFRKKTKKRRMKMRGAALQSIIVKLAIKTEQRIDQALAKIQENPKGAILKDEQFIELSKKLFDLLNLYKDLNSSKDVNSPISLAPADINPIGLMDGIWPVHDLQEFPKGNLYYGEFDGASANDKENDIK
jgi:hypothetical protein